MAGVQKHKATLKPNNQLQITKFKNKILNARFQKQRSLNQICYIIVDNYN